MELLDVSSLMSLSERLKALRHPPVAHGDSLNEDDVDKVEMHSALSLVWFFGARFLPNYHLPAALSGPDTFNNGLI